MTNPFASVALNIPAESRFLMIDVMRRLKAEHGSAIHLYCTTAQTEGFYRAFDTQDLFDSITIGEVLLPAARRPVANAEAVFAKARAHEARIGCTYNTLAVCHRHFGRGYALGGFYHPRSRHSELTSYVQIVNAYNAFFDFWSDEIASKGITLIIGGPKEVTRAAVAHGVAYRALAGARYKNYHFWAPTEFYENPEVEPRYHALTGIDDDARDIEQPYLVEQTHRKRFVRQGTVFGLGRELAHLAARRLYWKLRGYEKAKGYYGRDELRFAARKWRDTRRMTGTHMTSLDALKGRPFVFFPLHTEPEASLGQFSPEYFYQQAAIAALSRDLPAGVTLAVKETIHGVGRRPANFYDQIRELKNVVMLDMMEYGLDVVKQAALVATINGTAGFEGAVMGKPVIVFGRHNIYRFLPHVRTVIDEALLGDEIASLLSDDFDGRAARRDGARFLRAVIETSFDLHDYNYVDLKKYKPEAVENATRALVESLGAARPATVAAQ